MKVATVLVRRSVPLGCDGRHLYVVDVLEGNIHPGDYFFGEEIVEHYDYDPFFHNIVVREDTLVGAGSIMHIEHRLPGIPDGAEDITKAEAANVVSDLFWSVASRMAPGDAAHILFDLAWAWLAKAQTLDPGRLPF